MIELRLGSQFAAKVLGRIGGRTSDGTCHFGHVDQYGLDAVALALDLGLQTRHLVAIEDVRHAAINVYGRHVAAVVFYFSVIRYWYYYMWVGIVILKYLGIYCACLKTSSARSVRMGNGCTRVCVCVGGFCAASTWVVGVVVAVVVVMVVVVVGGLSLIESMAGCARG